MPSLVSVQCSQKCNFSMMRSVPSDKILRSSTYSATSAKAPYRSFASTSPPVLVADLIDRSTFMYVVNDLGMMGR